MTAGWSCRETPSRSPGSRPAWRTARSHWRAVSRWRRSTGRRARDPERPVPEEQAALRLTWQGVQAAALARALRPQGTEPIAGVFQGEADVRGGLASLAEIQAEFRLPGTTADRAGDRRGAGAGHDPGRRRPRVHGIAHRAHRRRLARGSRPRRPCRPPRRRARRQGRARAAPSLRLPSRDRADRHRPDGPEGGRDPRRAPARRNARDPGRHPALPGAAAGAHRDQRPGGARPYGHPARGVARAPGRRRRRALGRRAPGRHEDGGRPAWR